MLVAQNQTEALKVRQSYREDHSSVGFVPTMGGLHAGHLALVELAKEKCDRVIVSLFVNPTQFGPGEDYANYPRQLEEDLAKLDGIADMVFVGDADELYPKGFSTFVINEDLSQELCGVTRPIHFRGVLTIVLKLLNLLSPDRAFFGKKDYQQQFLIKKMCRDLNVPVVIEGGETIREQDGLAMSTRNLYLKPEEREVAPSLYGGLRAASEIWQQGERSMSTLIQVAKDQMDPKFEIEYVEVRSQEDLRPRSTFNGPAVILAAARLGQTRLIDNLELSV